MMFGRMLLGQPTIPPNHASCTSRPPCSLSTIPFRKRHSRRFGSTNCFAFHCSNTVSKLSLRRTMFRRFLLNLYVWMLMMMTTSYDFVQTYTIIIIRTHKFHHHHEQIYNSNLFSFAKSSSPSSSSTTRAHTRTYFSYLASDQRREEIQPYLSHNRYDCDVDINNELNADTSVPLSSNSIIITQQQEPTHRNMSLSTLTSILLRISYDGRHFTGWSSSNDDYHHSQETDQPIDNTDNLTSNNDVVAVTNVNDVWKRPKRRSRRYRHLPLDVTPDGSNSKNMKSGYVRSVQGVLQQKLAKLYGNVPISSIIVEGCSRTDKGVHATCMIAQIYCLSTTTATTTNTFTANMTNILNSSAIPGKRIPHPCNGTDPNPCFKSIPTAIPTLITSLNRMLYPDIQVMAYAHIPEVQHGQIPFHPTLSAHRKTYTYTFSIGPMHDPTQHRTVWYIGHTNQCNIDLVMNASQCLVGVHDFNAFSGAPRGKSDSIKRQSGQYNATCYIESINFTKRTDVWTNQNTISTYTVHIIGDRFLYKMIRFMMGAMIAVGKGQLSMDEIRDMLLIGQRGKEFECAPAHALILHDVQYNIPIHWQSV